MLGLDSDDGAGGGADSRSVVGESGSAMVRLSVFTVFGSDSGTVLFAGSSCDCGAGNKCCPGLSGRSDQDGLFALLNGYAAKSMPAALSLVSLTSVSLIRGLKSIAGPTKASKRNSSLLRRWELVKGVNMFEYLGLDISL